MKLNLWEKNGLSRVYVNEGQGEKIGYIEIRGGRLSAVSEHALINHQALLKQVIEHCGITAVDDAHSVYNQIKGFAARLGASAKSTAGGKGPRAWANQSFGRGSTGQYASPKPFGRDLAFDNIKNQLPVEIEVDHREPEEIDAYLAQVENAVVTRKHLPLGDFVINGHIVVERKTTRDFALSVQSHHLFDQAQRMGFQPDVLGVVLIEGDVFGEELGMLDSQITGALTCLTFVQGMTVFQTKHPQHTAYVLAKIAQHDRNGLGYNLTLRKSKPTAILDAQRFVLEGFNGITTVMADRLLREFGSVGRVLTATSAELLKVKGMGKKRVQDFLALIHASATAIPPENVAAADEEA
jgi:DNA excision repair protein ERCC-4